ncbi:MAG: secretin and TonB N-terminal domain-containing protein [Burkholderiales bacterium]|jgi:general secretion pathway protein D|nr:secretin and TonB N-terminal domain-containing protein [Burkholderiales bacterium]
MNDKKQFSLSEIAYEDIQLLSDTTNSDTLSRVLFIRWCRYLFSVALMVFFLVGCAGMQAYKEANVLLAEGKMEQGLQKLQEAVKLEPQNIEYRIALANSRASIVNRLVSAGETARRDGRLSEAEKIYRQVQSFDPENSMARQGLEAIVVARRHQLVIVEIDALLKKNTLTDLNDAAEKLRSVLSENPRNKAALHLQARIDEERAKHLRPEIKLAATFRKPISLEFRDAPLKSVLEVVAKVAGLNFFYDRDIRPDLKVTVFAKNTTIEDALRLLLVTNQLEQKILNENSLLIYPNTPQKIKDYQTLAVRSFYLANADVKAVFNSIKTIVKSKDVVVDERLGIIIVRDTPEAIRMAERIVSLQDLSDPEVMLEVEIMEIKRSRLLELGIQWPSQLTLSPLQIGGVPLTVEDLKNLTQATTQAAIGGVVLNARKEDQAGNILANPRIRVRNKEKAKIQIGDRVPAITTTSTSTGFVSESVNYIDVGLKLEVEPNIYLDDEVAIKINLEVSNLVREVLSKSGTLSYQIGTRGANTVLRLRDGETQILAGLISDEDRTSANKVPGLGDLPLAGRLFGSQKDDRQRSEILLSITPRIVRSIQRPDMLDAEFESGTESRIGESTLRLSEAIRPAAVGASDVNDSRSISAPNNSMQALASAGVNNVVRPPAANSQQTVTPDAANSAVRAAGADFSTAGIIFSWQAPVQIRVGEQFSAVLRVNSAAALRGLPIMLGFDPQLLQVVSVQEGEFFKQNNGLTNFSQRIDLAQGRVFAALVRQATTPLDTGINGIGNLITVNLKAIKPAGSTRLQLLSATPEPVPVTPVRLPIEHLIRIVP